MKREKFESIASAAEHLHQQRPRLYRFLLASMAVLGYAYILTILLVLLGLFALLLAAAIKGRVNSGAVRLLIFSGIICWLIVRGLWIRLSPPIGLTLTPQQTPRLFEMIEEISRRLGAPSVSSVVLDGNFNAGVMQIPRLGIFGFYKNYLVLGLPLLETLTPEQFRAVLAHEFGHLSGSHGKFSMWIYRVNQTWQQVMQNFARHRSLAIYLFLPFYKWFVPRLAAFSHVQNRLHEFEADRLSAKITGSEHVINALVRIHFYGELLDERFWPEIFKLADTQAEVPAAFSKISAFVRTFEDYIAADFAVRRAFQAQHEGADTHPVLAERVKAVESEAINPERIEQLVRMCMEKGPTAAAACLDGQREELTAQIDGLWQKMLAVNWAERHAYMKQRRQELEDLKNRPSSQTFSAAESMEQAMLTEAIWGSQKALPLFRKIMDLDPENMEAVFAAGRIMLEQKNSGGRMLIERVMEKRPSSRTAGCQLLAKFYYDLGELEEARTWRFKMEDEYNASASTQNERATLSVHTKFLPHGLDEGMLEKIRRQLAAINVPMRVCLARKMLKQMPEEPCYVLVAHRVVPWWSLADSGSAAKKNQLLLEELCRNVVTTLNIFMYVESSPSIYKKMQKIPGAKIYDSSK